jgi:hypothetical protein
VKQATKKISVEKLNEDASFALLTHGMGPLTQSQDKRLRELCAKFQGWPLLLNLANGHFRKLRDEGGLVHDAIKEYSAVFESKSILGWDDDEPGLYDNSSRRRMLAGLCIQTGLTAVLNPEQRRLFRALAVFPDDTDIPFDVVDMLWAEMSKQAPPNNRVNPSALRLRAQNYSLLREFNAESKTFRLHDEMLTYLRGGFDETELQDTHGQLVEALSKSCKGDWSNLPADNDYGWTHLLQHMETAGRTSEANALRVSYPWLKTLLGLHQVEGLIQAFRSDHLDEASDLVRRAIQRSARVLRTAPDQLPLQLYGRLGRIS